MENINKTPVDEVREEYFDQSVEELGQLESEQERKPDNEKIRARIEEVKTLLDKLLSELDDNATPRMSAQKLGSQSLGASRVTAEHFSQKPTEQSYIDSQGFVHSTPEEARGNEPDNWRKSAAQ
ncbi:hypothetical protein IKF30_02195 [Candidatus Saccharibacteria bacterium]|nr:hypothetical protein [Candidatus Saccharibacteria bacterium]